MTTIHIYYFSCYKITCCKRIHAFGDIRSFSSCSEDVNQLTYPHCPAKFFLQGTADNTRCNCIHPDIMFSEFGCQLFSESMNTTFACYGSCGRETGDSMINQHGSNIDDRAATIVDHR